MIPRRRESFLERELKVRKGNVWVALGRPAINKIDHRSRQPALIDRLNHCINVSDLIRANAPQPHSQLVVQPDQVHAVDVVRKVVPVPLLGLRFVRSEAASYTGTSQHCNRSFTQLLRINIASPQLGLMHFHPLRSTIQPGSKSRSFSAKLSPRVGIDRCRCYIDIKLVVGGIQLSVSLLSEQKMSIRPKKLESAAIPSSGVRRRFAAWSLAVLGAISTSSGVTLPPAAAWGYDDPAKNERKKAKALKSKPSTVKFFQS